MHSMRKLICELPFVFEHLLMVVSIFQGVVSKEYCRRFAGDYSATEYIIDLLMLVFLGSGYLVINASSQKVRKSSKQINIPITSLNN